MRIAIQGCCHGELGGIFAALRAAERRLGGAPVDLLLVCGDFQALRDPDDLETLACPPKFRRLGDFHRFYAQAEAAPVPTVFIGGNHEASNYLLELFHGGWVCPNIYYLGVAGCINFGGLRIAGASGIYKSHDYQLSHHEREPLDQAAIRSIYHLRMIDIFRLAQLNTTAKPIDVFLSHEWPTSVVYYGDTRWLLKKKPFWKDEVARNEIGAPPLEHLLHRLQPKYWFAAHMHVKFAAMIVHGAGDHAHHIAAGRTTTDSGVGVVEPVANPDEIQINDDDDDEVVENEKATTVNADSKSNMDSDVNTIDPVANPDEIQISDDDEIDDMDADNRKQQETLTADTCTHGVADPNAATITETQNQNDISDHDNATVNGLNQHLDHQQQGRSPSLEPHKRPRGSNTIVPESQPSVTRFLALDKCLPGRDFLQILDIPTDETVPKQFYYDEEWLAIVRATYPLLTTSRKQPPLPSEAEIQQRIQQELQWVRTNIVKPSQTDANHPNSGLAIPLNFVPTAPPYDADRVGHHTSHTQQGEFYLNPQTVEFCNLLQVPNIINVDGRSPVPVSTPVPVPVDVSVPSPVPVSVPKRAPLILDPPKFSQPTSPTQPLAPLF